MVRLPSLRSFHMWSSQVLLIVLSQEHYILNKVYWYSLIYVKSLRYFSLKCYHKITWLSAQGNIPYTAVLTCSQKEAKEAFPSNNSSNENCQGLFNTSDFVVLVISIVWLARLLFSAMYFLGICLCLNNNTPNSFPFTENSTLNTSGFTFG